MMITDEDAPRVTPRRPRVLGVGFTTLVVAVVAIGGFWLIAGPGQVHTDSDGDPKVMRYSTVQAMAQHLGCADSLRPAENPGSSSSSGECTYGGALVEFRIYPTEQQTMAWLDGTRGRGLDDPGMYGGTWAAVIHSMDRDLINRAMLAVQS
jgi:hypothetical protein